MLLISSLVQVVGTLAAEADTSVVVVGLVVVSLDTVATLDIFPLSCVKVGKNILLTEK